MAIGYGTAQPKPTRDARQKAERKAERLEAARVKVVREAVFEREGYACRVCGKQAQSMHELRFRSLGGEISLENSIAVCGSGTTGCHGELQAHRIVATDAHGIAANLDANKPLRFSRG